MSAEDLDTLRMLHPAVQRAIQQNWAAAGITQFRPIQRKAIPSISAGSNCLILSPTAGGKTDAAFLPAISRAYESATATPGVHVIFVAPLKALLNDLEVRLQVWLAHMSDVSVFKWHGDVSAVRKTGQLRKPAAILLTTPESLDVLLARKDVKASEYFTNLQTFIVDEAHYFAADSRGAQLISEFARIENMIGRRVQRVGLSATVGDPPTVASWLGEGVEVLAVDPAPRQLQFHCEWVDDASPEYQTRLSKLLRNLTARGKSIVFGNSRRDVELTARLLESAGANVMAHHGSVSKLLREDYEEQMRTNTGDCVISATSTLELGIDIGDLHCVIQKDRLPNCNSFLQRIGRAGRKTGIAEIGLVAGDFEDYIFNLAVASLGCSDRYCEPLRPSRRRYDILFQQLLLSSLASYGISSRRFWESVAGAYCFSEITQADFRTLTEHWLDLEYLRYESPDLLLIGPVIEKEYGVRNFMELYSVFDVNEHFTVVYDRDEIGYVESWFALSLHEGEAVFQLAGRKWRVLSVNRDLKRIDVRPTGDALPPNWRGGALVRVERKTARRYHDILCGLYMPDILLSPAQQKWLHETLRGFGRSPMRENEMSIQSTGPQTTLETYAGTMLNQVLSFGLKAALPAAQVSFDFKEIWVKQRGLQADAVISAVRAFAAEILAMQEPAWINFLEGRLEDFKYSRFSRFVPAAYSARYAATACFELEEVQTWLGATSNSSLLLRKYQK